MQKITKWYDLKKIKNGYRIFYSFSIRIQAIFLFVFSMVILYFQIFEDKGEINLTAAIIFGIVFTISLTFSLFIDSFLILFEESKIIRKNGFFPFVIAKEIKFNEIQSISSEILEKQDKSKIKDNIPSGYYSGKTKEFLLIIELKNGKDYKIAFGKGDETIFNKFIEELKKFA